MDQRVIIMIQMVKLILIFNLVALQIHKVKMSMILQIKVKIRTMMNTNYYGKEYLIS